MADKLSIEQRHYNMSRIRGKDTKPEMIVRRYLWKHGYRYRLNHRRLPGKPDIVLRKYKSCIFINGCFWHGHQVHLPSDNLQYTISSECCKIPRTNRDFWVKKITRNQERDAEVKQKLSKMGWNSITIWECELKPSKREATLTSLLLTLSKILLHTTQNHKYDLEEEAPSRLVADETEIEISATQQETGNGDCETDMEVARGITN